MRDLLKSMFSLIFFDIKKLIFVELFIKVMGFLVIYPLFRIGFYYSLELSGFNYISNNQLIDYLKQPSTIIIAFIFLFIFSVYLLLEYVLITIMVDDAKKQIKSPYILFIKRAIAKYFFLLKKYHFFILLPIFIFFIIFEFGQIFIFTSSITLPEAIIIDLQTINLSIELILAIYLLLLWFYIGLIFFTHSLVHRSISLKEAYKHSRKSLSKKKIKSFIFILSLNVILNLLLIFIYGLILFIASQIIGLIHGSNVIYSIIITSMYSIYWIIAIIFSAIIIPLNISLISHIYYQSNDTMTLNIETHSNHKQINKKCLIGFSVLAFLLVFAFNIASISSSVSDTEDRFQILKQEEIIAHRGASMQAPENTLAALDLAINQGADAVEFDVKGTKDNIPILLHDDTLIRTTQFDIKLNVKDINYETIEKYEAGSWFSEEFMDEKIPTLEEAFQLIAGRTVAFIDMKTSNRVIELEVVRLIEVYEMENHVKIMSFDVNQLSRFKKLNPNLETILLVSNFYGQIDPLFYEDDINHFALRISIIDRDPSIVKRIHNHGKRVYAWTVDTENQIVIGVNADVDGFITKRPIEAREIAHSKTSNDNFTALLERLFKVKK
ncbi:MAG: glycerophosphodiester phosphodiesterase [Candidatus Izemoplasmatales bacterium]